MYLSVHLEPVADTTVVISLTGELDAGTVPVLSATLQPVCASPVTHVVVVCDELWFCDLSGLARLTAARLDLLAKGGDLVLVEANSALRRLISLVDDGRTPRMTIHSSLPEALAACGVRHEPQPRRHLPRMRGVPAARAAGRTPRRRPPPRGMALGSAGTNPLLVRSARLREQVSVQVRMMQVKLLRIEQTRALLDETRARCRRTLEEVRLRRLRADDRLATSSRRREPVSG
jgi:anti-anti-sigma factor